MELVDEVGGVLDGGDWRLAMFWALSSSTVILNSYSSAITISTPILLLPLTVPPLMAPPSAPPLPLPVTKSRLLILYASQTGNAVDVARRVGGEAVRGGCPSVDVLSMDIFDPSYLPDEGFVVFIVSTMGQGFLEIPTPKESGSAVLEGLQYAVFGLGDSGYQKYNFPAKKLDRMLFDLGARQIIKKALEKSKAILYEGALDPWLQSLWQSLNETNAPLLPRIMDILHPNLDILGGSNVEVMYHKAPQDASISDSKTLIGRARSMSPALKFHDDGEPPYMLQIRCFCMPSGKWKNSSVLVTNQRLTTEESERDVRHFELEDPCSAIRYQAGDALEILPCQNPSAVDAFIKRCNLDPECYITIMSYFATAEPEKRRLKHLVYNQKENLTVLKVLQDFPSVQMPFQ
ncbi:hypothetical protein PR202_gb19244 [Eleusine coracana subsp. coracana]|uniref:Flavodoxin-like domain-containing protein n=1 Tax=Eleusine coracana subsp. coracana TaxID=191504 RepID=A0AAV5F5H7_ELECO|nr:hypothetical protein PR202_gb19244 [Eleusine coracana subsp. coracana]